MKQTNTQEERAFNKSGKAPITVNLKEGQVVEFYENADNHKYGVVTSGFGMSQQTMGRAIFAYFGKTEEEAIEHFKYFDERYALRGERHPKNRLCRNGEVITRDEKDDRSKGRWEVTETITFGEKSPVQPIEKGQHLVPKKDNNIMYVGTTFVVEETGKEYTLAAADLVSSTVRAEPKE